MSITAQDLYNYTLCAHRVYLDANADPAERSEVGPFVQLLWEKGLQTEREYLASLGDIPCEDLQGVPFDEACRRTEALMTAGASLIYQGGIRCGDWAGRPDLLLKHTDARSRLGDFYYEPIDIKAGKGWEGHAGGKARFKAHYAFQILFYREILKKAQGHLPALGRIINVDKAIEVFDPADFEARFREALDEVARLVSGAETSEPVLGSACTQCHWYARCRRWVEGTRDPSGLFRVGKAKFALKAAGLATLYDIARMDVEAFAKGPNKIPHVGLAGLRHMKERARVRLAGEPVIRTGYAFPARTREIYFDIEDDPTRDLTYLFGLLERDGHQGFGYRCFLARSAQQEEETVRAFWSFLAAADDAVFYVYSAKERSSLVRLRERYGLDETVLERYIDAEYDLYTDLVIPFSDWPTYSYGIKPIAGLIGFKWRDPSPGGASSIAWYNDYLRHPEREDILQRILRYNEDDCRAMVEVKAYFEKRLHPA